MSKEYDFAAGEIESPQSFDIVHYLEGVWIKGAERITNEKGYGIE